MDIKSLRNELDAAYKKLGETEDKLKRALNHERRQYKVQQILIAAGFITNEKIREAEDILIDLRTNHGRT